MDVVAGITSQDGWSYIDEGCKPRVELHTFYDDRECEFLNMITFHNHLSRDFVKQQTRDIDASPFQLYKTNKFMRIASEPPMEGAPTPVMEFGGGGSYNFYQADPMMLWEKNYKDIMNFVRKIVYRVIEDGIREFVVDDSPSEKLQMRAASDAIDQHVRSTIVDSVSAQLHGKLVRPPGELKASEAATKHFPFKLTYDFKVGGKKKSVDINEVDTIKTQLSRNSISGYEAHSDSRNSALNHDDSNLMGIHTEILMFSTGNSKVDPNEVHVVGSYGRRIGKRGYVPFKKVKWDVNHSFQLVDEKAELKGTVLSHVQMPGANNRETGVEHKYTGTSDGTGRCIFTGRQLKAFQNSDEEVLQRVNDRGMSTAAPVVPNSVHRVRDCVKAIGMMKPCLAAEVGRSEVAPTNYPSLRSQYAAADNDLSTLKATLTPPPFFYRAADPALLREHELIHAKGSIGPNMHPTQLAQTSAVCRKFYEKHTSLIARGVGRKGKRECRCCGPLFDETTGKLVPPGEPIDLDLLATSQGITRNKNVHRCHGLGHDFLILKRPEKNHKSLMRELVNVMKFRKGKKHDKMRPIKVGGVGGAQFVAGANEEKLSTCSVLQMGETRRPATAQGIPEYFERACSGQQVLHIAMVTSKNECLNLCCWVAHGITMGFTTEEEKNGALATAVDNKEEIDKHMAELHRLDPGRFPSKSLASQSEPMLQKDVAVPTYLHMSPMNENFLDEFECDKDSGTFTTTHEWKTGIVDMARVERPMIIDDLSRVKEMTRLNRDMEIPNDEVLAVRAGFHESVLRALETPSGTVDGGASTGESFHEKGIKIPTLEDLLTTMTHHITCTTELAASPTVFHKEERRAKKTRQGQQKRRMEGIPPCNDVEPPQQKRKLATEAFATDSPQRKSRTPRDLGDRHISEECPNYISDEGNDAGSSLDSLGGNETDEDWNPESDPGEETNDDELEPNMYQKKTGRDKEARKRIESESNNKCTSEWDWYPGAETQTKLTLLPPRPLASGAMKELRLSSMTMRPTHPVLVPQDPAALPCGVAAKVFQPCLRELDESGRFVHRAGPDWVTENIGEASTYLFFSVVCAVFNPGGILHIMHQLDKDAYMNGATCPRPEQIHSFLGQLSGYKYIHRFYSRVFSGTFQNFGTVRAFLEAMSEHGADWLGEATTKRNRDEALEVLRQRLQGAVNGIAELEMFHVQSIVRLFETLVHEPFGPVSDAVPHGSGGEEGALLLSKILGSNDKLSKEDNALDLQVRLVDVINRWAGEAYDGKVNGISRQDAKLLFESWGLVFEEGVRKLRHVLGFGKFLDASDTEHMSCVLNKLLKNTRASNISEKKEAHHNYCWPVYLPDGMMLRDCKWAKPYLDWHAHTLAAYRKLYSRNLLRPLPSIFIIPGAKTED